MNINAQIPLVKVPEGYPNIEDLYLQYSDHNGLQQLQLRVDHAVQDYAIGQTRILDTLTNVSQYISESDSDLLYSMIMEN